MKKLGQLHFTIQEFIDSPSMVLSKARSLDENSNKSTKDIMEYLEGRCRQMMLDSFSWASPQLPIVGSGFMIGLVDGNKVEYYMNAAPRRIEVGLYKNGDYTKKSIELDSDSLAIFTVFPYDQSELSEYGLQSAKSLAVDLYYRK